MCGISLLLSCHSPTCIRGNCCSVDVDKLHISLLKSRGPDNFTLYNTQLGNIDVIVNASVLHQRGQCTVTGQPAISENGSFLLWNGEIFNIDALGMEAELNDTSYLLQKLKNASPIEVISKVNGPFAFAFLDQLNRKLWFGKDIFGRRSLLWKLEMQEDNCQVLHIASIADGSNGWEDVPSNGIFCLDLEYSKTNFQFPLMECFYWSCTPTGQSYIPIIETSFRCSSSELTVETPILQPLNTIECRNRKPNETLLEYVSNLYSLVDDGVCPGTYSNLINFENANSNAPKPEMFLEYSRVLEELSSSPVFNDTIQGFVSILSESVEKRVKNQPFHCKHCFFQNLKDCSHASLAVLFSGGIDSMILAYMADRHMPDNMIIDLLNVSFEHSAKDQFNKHKPIDKSFMSPDRKTGLQGYNELKTVCPGRCWNFVEINVTATELLENRENRIKYLIKPLASVLDDSIGCALWFASRGNGVITNENGEMVQYCSPARVVLVGMGADEQLAGYSRHRSKYASEGWMGLLSEISLEIDRISQRNLGRDDRIVSDSGREARFPFLDEKLVAFLNSLPIHLKVNLEFPRGLGEKLLMRLTAHALKLKNSAVLPKRAIQFGSRIAFIDGKEKGSNVCSKLIS